MAQLPMSGIPLFRLFGIQVYLHWSWLIIALIEIQNRRGAYDTMVWNVAEYLALFGIVLMHEFGHALACKSVGGRAERIMLWPLGGVAFVDPPQRPGAVLWSIVAGPLVNVVLLPVTFLLCLVSGAFAAWQQEGPLTDPQHFILAITLINAMLLIFNLLPIYPLDGGQILRAILWFMIGQGRSLMVASVIGFIGAGIGLVLAIWTSNIWLILLAAFAAMQSWAGFQSAKAIRALVESPRRHGYHCPRCGQSPPVGPIWRCTCGQPFDVFEGTGKCPNCGGFFNAIPCPACGAAAPPFAWETPTSSGAAAR